VGRSPAPHGDVLPRPLWPFGQSMVDSGWGYDEAEDRLALVRYVLSGTGEVERSEALTLPEPERLGSQTIVESGSESVETGYFYPPFAPVVLEALGPGGWRAVGASDGRDLVLHGPSGEEFALQPVWGEGPPLSPSERSEAEESVRVDLARAGARAGQLSLVVPTTRPPLNGLYFDQEGRVWVELLPTVEGVAEAVLFGRDGVALEVRSWPADVQLSGFGWVGERSALGTAMRDGRLVGVLLEW
jgi:hypothetical protein